MKKRQVTISSSRKPGAKLHTVAWNSSDKIGYTLNTKKNTSTCRQPFQHIPSSWNHRVGCHDMSTITSENLKILFNPWIVSSSLKSLKSPVKAWKCVSIAEFSIILWKSLKSPMNTWKCFSILSPYFFEITKVTSEHLKILFNPLKSPVKT